MMKFNIQFIVRQILNSATALTVTGILLIYSVYNSPAIFHLCFGKPFKPTELFSIGFMIFLSFICFVLIPVLISKIIYKQKLHDIGLFLPKNKMKTFILTLLTIAVLIPGTIFIAKEKSVIHYYTLNTQNKIYLIVLQLALMPIYYFCEEFFFRGFLLINLWNKVKWNSFWITDILFTLAHLNKPIPEFLLAIPTGFIFAVLAINTRSIYPTIIVHYLIGVVMIFSVNNLI